MPGADIEAQDWNGMQQPDRVQEVVGMQVLHWVTQGLGQMHLC